MSWKWAFVNRDVSAVTGNASLFVTLFSKKTSKNFDSTFLERFPVCVNDIMTMRDCRFQPFSRCFEILMRQDITTIQIAAPITPLITSVVCEMQFTRVKVNRTQLDKKYLWYDCRYFFCDLIVNNKKTSSFSDFFCSVFLCSMLTCVWRARFGENLSAKNGSSSLKDLTLEIFAAIFFWLMQTSK